MLSSCMEAAGNVRRELLPANLSHSVILSTNTAVDIMRRAAAMNCCNSDRMPPAHAESATRLSTSGVLSSCTMSCRQGSSPTVSEKCCGSFSFDAGLSFVLSCSMKIS